VWRKHYFTYTYVLSIRENMQAMKKLAGQQSTTCSKTAKNCGMINAQGSERTCFYRAVLTSY